MDIHAYIRFAANSVATNWNLHWLCMRSFGIFPSFRSHLPLVSIFLLFCLMHTAARQPRDGGFTLLFTFAAPVILVFISWHERNQPSCSFSPYKWNFLTHHYKRLIPSLIHSQKIPGVRVILKFLLADFIERCAKHYSSYSNLRMLIFVWIFS